MKTKQPFMMHSTPRGHSYLSSPDDGAPVLTLTSCAGSKRQNDMALEVREHRVYGLKGSSDNVSSPCCLTSQVAGEYDEKKGWFEAFPGERLKVRVHSAKVDGNFTILENVADHGVAAPMHIHTRDEVFHVLEGEVLFSIDGETSVLQEGGEMLIPAGTPHAWRNNSGNQIRALVFFAPGGIEELYFRAAGMTHKEIAELAVQYGTIVVGLPIPK